MIRNFSTIITDLRGNPIVDGGSPQALLAALEAAAKELGPEAEKVLRRHIEEKINQPVQIGPACAEALVAPFQDEQGTALGEKVMRNALAERIVRGGEVDVTAEDIVTMKQCASKYFTGARIPAVIATLLDGEPAASTPSGKPR